MPEAPPERRARLRIIIAAGAFALAVAFILDLLVDAGVFRSVELRLPGNCRIVSGAPGPEDITFNPVSGFAFVSSQDRRAAMDGQPVPGAIYRYRPGQPDSLHNLTPGAGTDFRPHGISLVRDEQGRARLFVVNHPGGNLFNRREDWPEDRPRHTIEVFDLIGDELVHVRTHADTSMVSPNDVVALDFERFYFTNDHGSGWGWRRTVEDWLRLPRANVVYFDGNGYTIAADRLTYANGINLSPDRETLYVAETTRNRLTVYTRDPASGALSRSERIGLAFGVDNIEVEPDTGDLWLAGHPKLLDFLAHSRDGSRHSPSVAARITFDPRRYGHEVFAGTLISGASVAAPTGEHVLIGAVFSPYLLECELSGSLARTNSPEIAAFQ